MSFHCRVKLDYPVSMGGYHHPRDPSEPIGLHLVHVPNETQSGHGSARHVPHRPHEAAGDDLRRFRGAHPRRTRSHARARAAFPARATSRRSRSTAGRTAIPTASNSLFDQRRRRRDQGKGAGAARPGRSPSPIPMRAGAPMRTARSIRRSARSMRCCELCRCKRMRGSAPSATRIPTEQDAELGDSSCETAPHFSLYAFTSAFTLASNSAM